MDVIRVSGSPASMGEQFGSVCRVEIAELYRLRIHNAIAQSLRFAGTQITEPELLALAERCLPVLREWAPEVMAELEGIARGSGLTVAQIWAMNNLTDLRDLAGFGVTEDPEGCTAVLVGPHKQGPWLAQTWDLATDNMPFVRLVHRQPERGPRTACLTLTGCLSLIGVNEVGVALGTTNLRTRKNRFGVGYLDIIHRALTCRHGDAAVRVVEEAPRAGAHFYCVADGQRVHGLETTPSRVEARTVHGVSVQTNHFTEPSLRPEQVQTVPLESSRHRLERASRLSETGTFDLARLQAILSDGDGEHLAIERHGHAGISTNAATVIHPETRRLWAVHGPPSLGTWVTLDATSGEN